MPIFHQKQLDMANGKCFMTIGMEKWRKCTSQIYDFWNFIAQIFAKQVERFSKIMNLWKIWKLPIWLAIFWPYMVEYDKQKLSYDNQRGKMKKYTSQIFFILETLSQRFVLNILRDFRISSNYEKYQNWHFYRTFFEPI